MPPALQTLGWWGRPIAFLEGARARYGQRFTIRLLGQGRDVNVNLFEIIFVDRCES